MEFDLTERIMKLRATIYADQYETGSDRKRSGAGVEGTSYCKGLPEWKQDKKNKKHGHLSTSTAFFLLFVLVVITIFFLQERRLSDIN